MGHALRRGHKVQRVSKEKEANDCESLDGTYRRWEMCCKMEEQSQRGGGAGEGPC